MKIDDSYTCIKLDNDTRAKEVANELDWMWNDIQADYAKIEVMRKKLFYKQNEFDRICQRQLDSFNSRCALFYMKEKFEKYWETGIDIAKDNEFLSSFVANYFPKWVWPGLTFRDIVGYHGDQWWVSFVWNPKKKVPFKPIIQICITNPENISVQDLYNPEEERGMRCVERCVEGHHKTVVSVFTENDFCSDWVGEAYMNNEIIDIIDRWAKGFLEGKKTEESGDAG